MDRLTEEMVADAQENPNVGARAALDRIASMVTIMRGAEAAVSEAEAVLKRRRAELFKIRSEDLPELLRESGFRKLTLDDGTSVEVTDEIECHISEDRAAAAHAWLREHGYGGVVKTNVVESFGRDEVEKADALLVEMVERFGERATMKENVHPMTLKALLKELMARGEAFPMELFGVVPFSLARLKLPRK